MSDEKLLKRGDILKDTYKVETFLGGGAFGEVYRVKHALLENRYAVKIVKEALNEENESELKNTLDEARLLARFDHRNIVKVHDAGITVVNDEEHVFFVMDFIPGGDLDDYWRSFGSRFMPVDTAINIIKQICLGLNILHKENPPMIHRDIKPQNIMIGYDDEGIVAKLTDFGLAKRVDPQSLLASAKGTLAYKAPEFLKEIDNTSTDIFAVGVTFYLLLTDKLPYPVSNELEVLTGKWLDKTPEPLKKFNPLVTDKRLENIVFTAISTDPDKRYKNAQELLDAIIAWENSKDQPQSENKKEEDEEEKEEVEVEKEKVEVEKEADDVKNEETKVEKEEESKTEVVMDSELPIPKIAKFYRNMKTYDADDAMEYVKGVELGFSKLEPSEIQSTSNLFAKSLNAFIRHKIKTSLDGDNLEPFLESLNDLMKLLKIAEAYANESETIEETEENIGFLKKIGADEQEEYKKPEFATNAEQHPPEQGIINEPETFKKTTTEPEEEPQQTTTEPEEEPTIKPEEPQQTTTEPEEPQQTTTEPEEPQTSKEITTKKTLEGVSFVHTSDALAILYDFAEKDDDKNKGTPLIPSDQLVKKALNMAANFDYERGVELLEQAFEQNPEYKNDYEYLQKLWKCFILIKDSNSIDTGIENLKDLINNDELIRKDYGFSLDILSSKDPEKIENEALEYIHKYDTEKASILMEIAMLMDENIKNKYQNKIKNWKRGILN